MERNACWEREATSYLAEDENVTTIIMNMQKTEKILNYLPNHLFFSDDKVTTSY